MLRTLVFLICWPMTLWAASPAELLRLHEALQTNAMMDILSEEGLAQADELRSDMFPGRSAVGWATTVNAIYAPERLDAVFRKAFDAELADADVAPLLAFYESEPGTTIANLEVSARRAIMSDEVEAAARAAYEEIAGTGSDRETLFTEFAELNDLIDRNVAGALNANLAFYRGLASGEGFDLDEEQMLRDVWAQEAEIRADTEGWVFGFMTFAYEPLSDDDLRAYVDVSESEAGRDLNRALFAGFDAVFLDVSYAIGAAAADFSLGDEL